MLLAAKHGKDRNFKLCEDEITSCVFGPLAFMSVEEVWRLFRKWLPFTPELWPKETPSDLFISFWENLKKSGRVEPDIIFRFEGTGRPLLTVMFEVKWSVKGKPRVSHDPQLVNQWAALSGKERERTRKRKSRSPFPRRRVSRKKDGGRDWFVWGGGISLNSFVLSAQNSLQP